MFNQGELRKRPTYNELIQEIEEDVRIVLPDRRAKFLRDSPYLSYLDNETYLEVEDQQKQIGIQQQKEASIREQTASSEQTASVIRAQDSSRRALPSFYSRGSAVRQRDDPDDFFSTSSPSGEPNIPGAISMSSPQLTSILNQSEPKTLNLTPLMSDAQPNQHLAEAVMDTGGSASSSSAAAAMDTSGSASSSSAAAAMDESVPMEDAKAEKRKGQNGNGNGNGNGVRPKAKAKSFAKPAPDNRTQLRSIIEATPQKLTGREIQSLTANVNNGFDVPEAIQNSVRRGKLDEERAKQLEKEYEDLMKDVESGQAEKKTPKSPRSPKAGERTVKSDKFKKASQQKPQVKINPTTGFADQGTEIDKSKVRTHWNSKGIGYIKDQLELRGFKISNQQLKGKNKLTKKDLLGILYTHDKI